MINKKLYTLISLLVAAWSLSCYSAEVSGADGNAKEEIVLKIAVTDSGKATLTDNKTGKKRGISPFLMTTDDEGNIVVFDLEGNVMEPTAELSSLGKPSLENPITKIENINGISIIRVTGSHYEIICTSTGYYVWPLPH